MSDFKPGTVIFLNGTSSSGKTSLVQALQDEMETPYLEMGIDKFIWMLPERYLERPLWDEVLGKAVTAGSTGHDLVRGMHRSIAAAVRDGWCVLVDHVLVEPHWVLDCASLFHSLPAFLVGVYCPLAVLEEREQARKNRTLGQARSQFDVVHAHGVYDFTVDTALYSPRECAAQIKHHVTVTQPVAFRRLMNIAKLENGYKLPSGN